MNPYLLILIAIVASGCAAPNTATQHAGFAPEPESIVNAEEAGPGEALAAQEPAASSGGGIEALAAPQVTEASAAMIPENPEPEYAIVCETAPRPGYILPVRICRHMNDIELQQAADQELFDDIKRNTALFTARLF